MPVSEHRAQSERRQAVFVPEVAVRAEKRLVARFDDGVVAHHRELEHHLVDFGVAVAAHGDDLVLSGVQQVRDPHGVVEVRYAVARPVVEEVAKQHDAVVAERVGGRERGLQCRRHAVNVTEKEYFHEW